MADSEPGEGQGKAASRLAIAVGWVLTLLLIGGGLVAVLVGPVWLLLAFLLVYAGGLFVLHLTIGIGSYRSVMRREWPKVEPLDDEDDDW
ncbi:MAG TPA: hypothetical protein VK915_12845 [Gaiellaceae bacterium]|nr:hypothetical protein [Gaiellaceae bacterium]